MKRRRRRDTTIVVFVGSMEVLASLLALSAIARAQQTYFISPRGDDKKDGRTEATAWRHAAKVNATAFSPGDNVQFQRGGVWREPLKPMSGGAVGSPVTFTSYGEGERPVFVGSDDVAVIGTRVLLTAPIHAVLLDDEFLRTPGEFHVVGDTLILTEPVRLGQKLRLIRRHDMVHLHQVDHVVIRGLAVDATARLHAGYGFRVEGCRDVLIDDCTATRCGKHHFGIINSTEVIVRRCKASLVMPDQGIGGASAFVSYSDNSRRGDSSRYEDCTVENYADAGNRQYPAFVTHGEGIGSIRIAGLTSRGADVSLNNRESGASLAVTDSLVEDAGIGLYGSSALLKNVILKRGVLTLEGEANRVVKCSILDYNPGVIGHQAAVVNTGRRNLLKGCTIELADSAKPFNAAIALVNPASALQWEDCIFGSHGAVIRTWFTDVKAAGCQAHRNKYPSTSTFIIKGQETPLTTADWQALGFDFPE